MKYTGSMTLGPIFCLLLGVSSDYAQPITGQISEVTCPVIGQAQHELTQNKRQEMAQVLLVSCSDLSSMSVYQYDNPRVMTSKVTCPIDVQHLTH